MVCQSGLLKRELTTIVRNLGQSYSLSNFKGKLSIPADYIIRKNFYCSRVDVSQKYLGDKHLKFNLLN